MGTTESVFRTLGANVIRTTTNKKGYLLLDKSLDRECELSEGICAELVAAGRTAGPPGHRGRIRRRRRVPRLARDFNAVVVVHFRAFFRDSYLYVQIYPALGKVAIYTCVFKML